MGKQVTIREKLRGIIRRYKHINPHKYLYNRKSDLQGRFTHITIWVLLHDDKLGYSIFRYVQRRKDPRNVAQWTALFTSAEAPHFSLYQVLTQVILPAGLNRTGKNWKFKSLLCWTGGVSDLSPVKNTAAPKTNKSAKKRTSNARNTNRSRHRNAKG